LIYGVSGSDRKIFHPGESSLENMKKISHASQQRQRFRDAFSQNVNDARHKNRFRGFSPPGESLAAFS